MMIKGKESSKKTREMARKKETKPGEMAIIEAKGLDFFEKEESLTKPNAIKKKSSKINTNIFIGFDTHTHTHVGHSLS